MIQEEYKDVIAEAAAVAELYFRDRLTALYVGGSVALGEALPGVSDIDAFIIVDGPSRNRDIEWCREAEDRLGALFPETAEKIHLSPLSVDTLRNDTNLYNFFLRYTSERVHGSDILAELEEEGIVIPEPSKNLAKSRLSFMEGNIKSILEGKFPKSLGSLPDHDRHATRKLARCLVFDSAWLLMVRDKFLSFEADKVLDALRTEFPEWHDLYSMTEEALDSRSTTQIKPGDFIPASQFYYLWLLDEIRSS